MCELIHDDWIKKVTSRFVCSHDPGSITAEISFHEDCTHMFHYIHITKRGKNTLHMDGHVFQKIGTIVVLIQKIVRTNVMTKFHEHWTLNVTSRVLTRATMLERTETIFELTWTKNVTSKFHEDWQIIVTFRKTTPPPGGHFHKYWAKYVTSRVLTRFYNSHIWTNAPPPCGHVFYQTGTIFELNWTIHSRENCPRPPGGYVFNQPFSNTSKITLRHQDRTIHVNVHDARRTTDDVRRTKSDHKSSA
ncbi:hypothetical protein DPMN_012371 [Dreissena polymorpha]|uniref:Uncharacterized protein n=1 Tax=Dreissena polymorpha TaxID=45954 RepID=A0A9D4N5P3_DREPO|nr:hypothetical protein DPMN_012371 [Dreissena polymorpha]